MGAMGQEELPLSRPDITEAEIAAVVAVLRTDRLSLGPQIEAFEAAVAQRAGRRFGVGVNSGTSGLHLCVRALGIGEGDEVITTPFTFVATANAVLFERARPVFVDIDPETYNMDPDRIEAAITPRTKAILPVEVFGNTAHFDRYEQFARKHGLAMIEDCCEALGGYLGDRPAGSFGDCGVFGFYPNKQITTGEGGMVVTDDERICELCRSMRNQGRKDQGRLIHNILGYNYRMGEMTAALGKAQMDRLESILTRRREIAGMYDRALADIREVHPPKMAGPDRAAWFVYAVRLSDRYGEAQRDRIIEDLLAAGIGCRAYFTPVHLQPYIRRLLGTVEGAFPATESAAARLIALPFFAQMTEEHATATVRKLCEAIARVGPTQVRVPEPTPEAPPANAPRPRRQVPFFRVSCDGNELRYVAEVLDSGWLTTGQKAFELEERFAHAVGARYACALNSCTAALHLAAEAVGIGPGDGVLVPTMTFTATAEVVRYLGAEPILTDVEYGTCLITPQILEAALGEHPNVKAAMIVHYGGHPAAMVRPDGPGILDICRQRGIRVIEDAAHAFPARIAGRMIGSLGDATCFSFYANKTMTTGEGGMLTTDDEALARRVRTMRLHGIDRDVWYRFSTAGRPQWEYDVIAPGYKYNMPDVNAAIGLAQLEQADRLCEFRRRCVQHYCQRLSRIPCLDLPACQVPIEDHAWHLLMIILRDDAPLTRDELINRLGERGIGTSVHYKPLHRMSYYRERHRLEPGSFPNAERVWRGCLSLPLFPSMSLEDVDYVCDELEEALS